MRYLTPALRRDLSRKAVLLSGPRQVGKSTLARSLLDDKGVYLNWDIRQDRKTISQLAWPKNASLVALDELHKAPKWKNLLKGVIDQSDNKPPLIVTGSARLEVFRKSGDALTGRTFHYRLHPVDLAESRVFLPRLSMQERLKRLLAVGGFPEAFLRPEDAERLKNDRLDFVLREDLRDLSRVSDLKSIGLLVELLRDRVGGQVSYSNLAEDLSVSAPTIKNWITILERLYLIYLVTPYSRKLVRGIRKEPKVYFFDCSAATEGNAARLENLVASTLLKYCHWQHDNFGKVLALHYFRDREKREVDFVVTEGRNVKWCIEVKTSDRTLSKSLHYLTKRIPGAKGVQLVCDLDRQEERDGIEIVNLAAWLENLFP